MKKVKLIAPAKVNLFLGIGPRRADGYHEVLTAMHALAMHDTLQMFLVERGEDICLLEENDPAQPLRQVHVKVEPGQGLDVSARSLWFNGIEPLDIPSESNLACKAVRILAEELGREDDETVRIVIEKHIPYQAGLGGGSSDAAAALLGAAHLWDVNDHEAIVRAACRLGSDVRFFLEGGCQVLEGRGEIPVSTLEARHDSLVVVHPNQGVSTALAYASFDKKPSFFDAETQALVRTASQAEQIHLANNLQEVAWGLVPEIRDLHDYLASFDEVEDLLLCGSGSAIFATCKSYTAAQTVATSATKRGYWARTTTFSSIRAAILPDKR